MQRQGPTADNVGDSVVCKVLILNCSISTSALFVISTGYCETAS